MPWQSAYGWAPPKRVRIIDDTIKADQALRWLSEGQGLLWRGDYHNAKQLLSAVKRRLAKRQNIPNDMPWPEKFHRVRQVRAQAARISGLLLIEMRAHYIINCTRAPSVDQACRAAYGERYETQSFVTPLTEIIGIQSAHQWQTKGLWIDELGAAIYPRWGVFAPTRHEYLNLVMHADLPSPCHSAVDVGSGTGILALLLAKRGVAQITATDLNPRALACAQENVNRLGFAKQITVKHEDLIGPGRFDLLVCNPPWLPGTVRHPLDQAVYDPGHQMLRSFLAKVPEHLNPQGQAWLILSDLAEHLHLRTRQELLQWIAEAGLTVLNRIEARPTHAKASDPNDPLAQARAKEITSIWQLCSLAETR